MAKLISTFCFILFFLLNLSAQIIINVPGDYSTIQNALNQAEDFTTIKVAAGIYYENIQWPFHLDYATLEGEGSDVTIIDGGGAGRVLGVSGGDDIVIKGFTIQNGLIENDPNNIFFWDNGAGLEIFDSSPTLEDIVVKDNFSGEATFAGAGLYCFNFHGTMKNCKVLNNDIIGKQNANILGGGFYARQSSGTFINCEFSGNRIMGDDISIQSNGAGFYIELIQDLTISNCVFDNNSISVGSGAGLWIGVDDDVDYDIDVDIINSQISNNISHSRANGAGMVLHDTTLVVKIDSCEFISNTAEIDENDQLRGWGGALLSNTKKLSINNSNFINNKARFGAGIGLSVFNELEGGAQDVNISSCNFSLNEAIEGSALYTRINFNMRMFFKNCVFAKNKGTTLSATGLLADQLDIFYEKIFFEHCTVAFNQDPIFFELVEFKAVNSIFWNPASIEFISEGSNFDLLNCVVNGGGAGVNTITEDPLFFSEDELIPEANSPCISGGSEDITIDTDINGNPRPFPANTPPDIGAYESELGISSTQHIYTLDIELFPNPVIDVLHFETLVDQYSVYNIEGKKLLQGVMQQSLSANELQPGVYTIEVWKAGEAGLLKFVKL